MKKFILTWEVALEESGTLLRDFVRQKGISRAALTDIKYKGGKLLVNEKCVTVRCALSQGDKVKVIFPKEYRSEEMKAENIPFTIVYEDDYVLVIEKEPCIPSIPSREHPTGTLANALLFYYDQQGISSTVHIVTRLDKDTSGLLLVAKNRFVHSLLSQQHKEKVIKRTYLAVVHGNIKEEEGIIDAPIGRKSESIIEREVRIDGQRAVTYFQVKERREDSTLVQISLETGRTHQIRVHFSFLGHPLLGDTLYGGETIKIKRQALHSKELSFYHPFLRKKLHFTSSLPNDIKRA